jgi:hypothetical protein
MLKCRTPNKTVPPRFFSSLIRHSLVIRHSKFDIGGWPWWYRDGESPVSRENPVSDFSLAFGDWTFLQYCQGCS